MTPRRKAQSPTSGLSRRETQILDALFDGGPASAGELCERIDDAPSETAMRTLLRILQEKGHVRHTLVGRRHVYAPAVSRGVAQKSAVRHLLGTFFHGAVTEAVATMLDASERPLTAGESRELIALIKDAQARGR